MNPKFIVTLEIETGLEPFGKHPEFVTRTDTYGILEQIVRKSPDVKKITLLHFEKVKSND